MSLPVNKILFLDIDGVLNTQSQQDKLTLDTSCINNLNSLLEDFPELKIVLTSTWRNHHALDDIQSIFDSHGFKGKIWSVTPNLELLTTSLIFIFGNALKDQNVWGKWASTKDEFDEQFRLCTREMEISLWVNVFLACQLITPESKMCILDDTISIWFTERSLPVSVETNPHFGSFNMERLCQVRDLFNSTKNIENTFGCKLGNQIDFFDLNGLDFMPSFHFCLSEVRRISNLI
jgi:hypothetical protein